MGRNVRGNEAQDTETNPGSRDQEKSKEAQPNRLENKKETEARTRQRIARGHNEYEFLLYPTTITGGEAGAMVPKTTAGNAICDVLLARRGIRPVTTAIESGITQKVNRYLSCIGRMEFYDISVVSH